MTRRTTVAALAGVLLIGSLTLVWMRLRPPRLSEGQGWLRQTTWDSAEYVGVPPVVLLPSPEKPSLVVDLPGEAVQEGRFVVIQRARPFVGYLGRQEGKGPVLYLDTNGNGRLSDERPLPRTERTASDSPLGRRLVDYLNFRQPAQSAYLEFGPVVASDPCQLGRKAGAFVLNAEGPWFVSAHPRVYYRGEVRLAGVVRTLALYDRDLDGRLCGHFSPAAASPFGSPCDMMAIDLDGNGRFDSDESFPLSDLVQFYGQYYRLDLTDDLKGLTFIPVRPQLGAVAIEAGDPAYEIRTGKAVLWSDAACGSFGLSRGVWDLPAGHYLLRTGDMEVRDAEGSVWLLRTRVQEGQGCQFDVSVGQTTELRLGPPFSAGIEIQRVLPLRISPTLAGSGGELYHPAGILRNRGTSRQPVFKIVEEQGTVLYTGADQSTWRVPGGFKGRVRVEVKWDVAPLRLNTESPWYSIGSDGKDPVPRAP